MTNQISAASTLRFTMPSAAQSFEMAANSIDRSKGRVSAGWGDSSSELSLAQYLPLAGLRRRHVASLQPSPSYFILTSRLFSERHIETYKSAGRLLMIRILTTVCAILLSVG